MKVTRKMRKAFFIGLLPVVLIFTPVAHVAAQSCIQPTAGLVSWWPRDGNTDDIVGDRNAVLKDNATFGTGRFGLGILAHMNRRMPPGPGRGHLN